MFKEAKLDRTDLPAPDKNQLIYDLALIYVERVYEKYFRESLITPDEKSSADFLAREFKDIYYQLPYRLQKYKVCKDS